MKAHFATMARNGIIVAAHEAVPISSLKPGDLFYFNYLGKKTEVSIHTIKKINEKGDAIIFPNGDREQLENVEGWVAVIKMEKKNEQ